MVSLSTRQENQLYFAEGTLKRSCWARLQYLGTWYHDIAKNKQYTYFSAMNLRCFCGIRFWSELFSQWHGKWMMHRCSFHESMSYLGGAMHQCPMVDTTFPNLSWWEKTAATLQVRVDTPTKPHEAAKHRRWKDDSQGLIGLVKWFSNNTYKKDDEHHSECVE